MSRAEPGEAARPQRASDLRQEGRRRRREAAQAAQAQLSSQDDVQTTWVQQNQQVQSPQCIEFGQQTSFLLTQTVMDLTDSLAYLNLMQNTSMTSVPK